MKLGEHCEESMDSEDGAMRCVWVDREDEGRGGGGCVAECLLE